MTRRHDGISVNTGTAGTAELTTEALRERIAGRLRGGR
jgi:hypothetical protein